MKKNESSDPLQKGNIIVTDTNPLLDDPEIIDSMRTGINANNLLVIPWTVMLELDKNKSTPGIGHEAREAVRRIRKAQKELKPNIIIEDNLYFTSSSLSKEESDHRIIATVAYISKQTRKGDKRGNYFGYQKIKFLTNDEILQSLSEHVFRADSRVSVEPLLKNRVKEIKEKSFTKIKLGENDKAELVKGKIFLSLKVKSRLKENEIVLFTSDFDASGKPAALKNHFLGIRKGDKLKIVRPDIKIYNEIGALNNGKTNWPQVAAIDLLLDPSIRVVFLQGGAGTGKTLLALAAGLEAKKRGWCKKIVIIRLPVPVDSKYITGLLPGGIEQKLAPWLLPIMDSLAVLCPGKNKMPDKSYEESNFYLLQQHGIFIQPFDYVKGISYKDDFVIVDEAQDLNQRQTKQIITRAGADTKMVFVGDLDQISEDYRHINRHNSGLPYAISRLAGEPMVGVVKFDDVVRGPLAALAERKL